MPVTQLTRACWTLRSDTGPDDAPVGHWDTEAQANDSLTDYFPADDHPAGTVKTVQCPAPCWVVSCDQPLCGDEPEDDEYGWSVHCETRGEAERFAESCDWLITTDGGALCPEDKPEPDPADRTVIEQIPGQLAIDGKETA